MLPDLQSTSIDGRQMTWREAGRGAPLVLVHGIGGHSGSWEAQFNAFSDDFRVIAWDAPGYGGSEPLADRDLSLPGYALSLVGLLKTLGAERAHLVGHSLGAIVISAASQNVQVEARSLTLLQPVVGSGMLAAEERERIRLARIADMEKLGAERFARERGKQILSASTPGSRVAEAVAVMEQVPQAGYLAAWEMMCRADLYSVLNMTCPTLVICGADDPVSPPAVGKSIAASMREAQFHCLEKVGHYASIEAPEVLNDLIRGFITSE